MKLGKTALTLGTAVLLCAAPAQAEDRFTSTQTASYHFVFKPENGDDPRVAYVEHSRHSFRVALAETLMLADDNNDRMPERVRLFRHGMWTAEIPFLQLPPPLRQEIIALIDDVWKQAYAPNHNEEEFSF